MWKKIAEYLGFAARRSLHKDTKVVDDDEKVVDTTYSWQLELPNGELVGEICLNPNDAWKSAFMNGFIPDYENDLSAAWPLIQFLPLKAQRHIYDAIPKYCTAEEAAHFITVSFWDWRIKTELSEVIKEYQENDRN